MTYDEWVEKFLPVKNHLHPGQGYDDTLFETYGKDLDYIRERVVSQHVWTLLDEGGHTWIAAGFHYVNRLGYFVTKNPWTDDTLEIVLDEPRHQAEQPTGFEWVIIDREAPGFNIVCSLPMGLVNAQEIAEQIADLLNAEGIEFDLSHEEDEDEDDSICRTEGCDGDANDGEGFDGYCGNCADRLEGSGECHVASDDDPKVCRYCGTHIDEERPEPTESAL